MCQMANKFVGCMDSFPAMDTAGNHNALTAIGHRRWLIYEIRKIMSLDFGLQCAKQIGLEHGFSSGEETGDGRIARKQWNPTCPESSLTGSSEVVHSR